MLTHDMIVLISVIVFLLKLDVTSAECTDIYGRSITPNTHFIPGPDICQLCVCDNTMPKWCKRVLCSPPQNCKSFVMGSSCCDYSCLDNTLPSGELRDEIDRRFLITIATAFLILTVLLFIIHKLRHRTTHGHLQNRQLNEDRRSIGSIGFITGSIGYLNLPNGHHFDDHSLVHFPIYKPNGNYFPRGEAPPPYEDVMADTPLNVTSQFITNERGVPQVSNHRRRSDSAGINQLQPVPEENNVYDPRTIENNVFVEESEMCNGGVVQHRTIPLSLCGNAEQVNTSEGSLPMMGPGRSSSLHKKNDSKLDRRSLGASSKPKCYFSVIEPNSSSPSFLSPGVHVGESPPQHRTLPLSASLSSPLPSTSDCTQLGVSPATSSSSAVNIYSFGKEDRLDLSVTQMPDKNRHHHLSCNKFASIKECQPLDLKERKPLYCLLNKERVCTVMDHDGKEEVQKMCEVVEDYYAECENCNLNVGVVCDGSDEYFSKQETMTLQRKLHETTTAKVNDQNVKVSLTLPTNSKSRRCQTKNCKRGLRSTKNSPFRTKLELFSSENEEEMIEEKKEEDKDEVKELVESKVTESSVISSDIVESVSGS